MSASNFLFCENPIDELVITTSSKIDFFMFKNIDRIMIPILDNWSYAQGKKLVTDGLNNNQQEQE
jgi:hypothetical protein